MAEALYRKYRPQVFEDVVGQEPIERTLKNAIANDKVSHAYLFCGPRGTGKTTTARLLAKALLCTKGPTPDPDGTCEDCNLVAEGAHPDVYELDAASRTGVENVREEIISRVHFAPTRGRYKVYIIDEVHMLSTAAFNALLKTLEEPPSHVVFILCTTDPQKVPETIHSRCQRFDFHRIAPESMVVRLGAICMAEGVEFEGEALDLVAQRADGGLRNALTSLEQIIAFENGKVTLAGAERLLGAIDSNDLAEIMAYIGRRDIANCFRWTASYVETGADLAQFVRDMAEHVRNLYVLALVGDDAELDVSETARRQLAGELSWFGPDRASRLLGVLGDLSSELRTASNQRLAFEIALTRMVRPDSELTIESLAERVEALEGGYSAVAHVLPGPAYSAPAQVPAPEEGLQGGFGGAPVATSAIEAQVPVAYGANTGAAADGTVTSSASYEPAMDEGVRQVPQARQAQQVPANQAVAMPAENTASSPGANEQASTATASTTSVNASAAAQVQEVASASPLANPAALQRIWQAALTAVKKQKQSYGVLFMNTKVLYDQAAGMVRVQFSPESTFAFNAAQKPDVQDVLEQALEKAAGQRVPFIYEQGGGAAVMSQAQPQAQAQVQPQPRQREEPQFDRRPNLQPESQPQPEKRFEPVASEPAPFQQASDVQAVPQKAVFASAEPSYDDEPPYDDVPYDYVPYEEYDYAPAPQPLESAPMQQVDAPYQSVTQSAAAAPAQPADSSTGASPAEPLLTPDGAIAEDPAVVEAMLQASFGAGVVLSEMDD